MVRPTRIACLVIVAMLAASGRAHGQATPAPLTAPIETARHGMVASQERLATRIGVEVLEKGGNAVDAAVAIGFALAVTHPTAGNIGGGGFMLVHLAARHEVDEHEPAAADIAG